jgi:preprotein translocase subunit Sec63
MLLQFARATRHTTPVLVLQKLCVAFSSDATAATPNHYQVLGVDRSAGAAEIKKAFRKVREEGEM